MLHIVRIFHHIRGTMSDTLGDVAAAARIVIGVDYGTTFSSVSWAEYPVEKSSSASTDLQHAAQRVQLAKRWDAGVADTAQVPTKLLYTQNGTEDLIVKWGYRAERGARNLRQGSTVVALAKLLLHRCEETRAEYDHLTQLQAQIHRDFILDYLTRLRAWLPSMPRPGPFHSTLATNARITYVFGVPAAWSDVEQDKLLRFAMDAGFANENSNVELSLAAEPEAMAVAYLATEDHGLKACASFISPSFTRLMAVDRRSFYRLRRWWRDSGKFNSKNSASSYAYGLGPDHLHCPEPSAPSSG